MRSGHNRVILSLLVLPTVVVLAVNHFSRYTPIWLDAAKQPNAWTIRLLADGNIYFAGTGPASAADAPNAPAEGVGSQRLHFFDLVAVRSGFAVAGPIVMPFTVSSVPVLSLLILTLPVAAYGIWRMRPRVTVSAGTCRQCGYDLRATPERCPECGAISQKSVA